ncbi:hypothetical protein Aperf_G00000021886 [Anoplocephala perfoliata]
MEFFVEMLVDMGYEKKYAELAVKETKCNGLEAALDWLVENPHKSGSLQPVKGTYTLFRIISKKKMEQAELQRQKSLEVEKRYRLLEKSLMIAKLECKEGVMKPEADDNAYREKERAEISRNGEEPIAKNASIVPAPAVTAVSKHKHPNAPSTDCRLQIRTPIGSPLKATFKPSEKLFDVIQFVCNNWPMLPDGTKRTTIGTHEVTLHSVFPTRKYTEEDKFKTLQELGLCPSAVLMAEQCEMLSRIRMEREIQQALEDEERRAKLELKEKKMKQATDQLEKERAEEKAYRENLLAEIARDREERIARNKSFIPAAALTPIVSSVPKPKNPVAPSTDCRLQIRTPIGSPLKATFKPSEKLFDVIQFVCNNWPMLPDGTTRTTIGTHEVTLHSVFPTRKYTEEDKFKTLQELGLCPSAVLMAEQCEMLSRIRMEREIQQALEDEERRAKLELKEKKMKQEIDQLKKERAEEKAYRENLLAEIARDREERIARNKGFIPAAAFAPIVSSVPKPKNPVAPSTDCRLQIRTPIGSPLKATFKPSEKLFDVIQFVCNNWPMLPDGTKRTTIGTHEVTLHSVFPTRKYTEEDKFKTLQELGLCPSAVLIAK